MQKRGRAQASVEYLMVVGLVFAIIVPMVYIFYSYSTSMSEEVTETKVNKIATDLVNAAEEVFYLGEPSKTTIRTDIPQGIFDVYISPNSRELVFRVGDIYKYREMIGYSNVKLKSYLVPEDIVAGRRSIRVEAQSDHSVIYTGNLSDARPRWCAYYISGQIIRNARLVHSDRKDRAVKIFMPAADCSIFDVYVKPDHKTIVTVIDIDGVQTEFTRYSDVLVQENTEGIIDITKEEAFYDFLYTTSNPPIVTLENPACRDGDQDTYEDILGRSEEEGDSLCIFGYLSGYDCNDDPLTGSAIYPGAAEICTDTIDNDCDTKTDCADPDCVGRGACPCKEDNTQSCYTGLPSETEEVAPCHAGTQKCSGGAWGICSDEQLPQTEICNDNIDNDCDTKIDCADPDCITRITSRITNADVYSRNPSLAWTGSEYGVAWHDYRDGNDEIYFARIDKDGTKSGNDVRITASARYSRSPSLAWTGSEYGVAWTDYRDLNNEIYFARIDAGGNKIGSDVRITDSAGDSFTNPRSLVWNSADSKYAVAWQESFIENSYKIYFAMIGADGIKIAGSEVRITDVQDSRSPSLIWTGSGYGIAWYDNRDGNNEIYFARIDEGGNKIVNSEIRITNHAGYSFVPSIVWNSADNQYAVAWYDQRDGNNEIYFARIGADGNEIGSDSDGDGDIDDVRITTAPEYSRYPSLVWNPDSNEYGVAWFDFRDGNDEIYFARIGADGNKIGNDIKITNNVAYSHYPSLAWTGSGYGVAWTDIRDGNDEIYFAGICSGSIQS